MRVSARTATVATAVLFAASLVAAAAVEPEGRDQQVATRAPSTTTTFVPVEDVTPTTTPTPMVDAQAPATTVPTGAVPRTPSAPKPKAAKAPPSGGAHSQGAYRYPGSLTFGFERGRTSWSGTSNGVTMSVAVDKGTPRTGEPVTFTFTASSPDTGCCTFHVSFRDGGVFSEHTECPPASGRRSATATTTHTYNKAGRWEFQAMAATAGCGFEPEKNAFVYGWMEVTQGAVTSQGPSQPTINVSTYGPTPHDGDPSYVSVYALARDDDGYVSRLRIDYGDGSTEEIPEKQLGCRPSRSGWPESSSHQTPNNPPPTHQYATKGTYKVTVTAWSQGCDGRDVQQVSGSFDWTYQ